ncbi:hypothetical protein CAL7102_05572 [Dulcicalothrix desertica PCC 7102]|nr:hypothetical protein CAL7102_05572 [Dulcicalothrix desertica PCC 7102]
MPAIDLILCQSIVVFIRYSDRYEGFKLVNKYSQQVCILGDYIMVII